jgi:hypothetical protein
VVANTHPPLSLICQQLPHPLFCFSHPFTPQFKLHYLHRRHQQPQSSSSGTVSSFHPSLTVSSHFSTPFILLIFLSPALFILFFGSHHSFSPFYHVRSLFPSFSEEAFIWSVLNFILITDSNFDLDLSILSLGSLILLPPLSCSLTYNIHSLLLLQESSIPLSHLQKRPRSPPPQIFTLWQLLQLLGNIPPSGAQSIIRLGLAGGGGAHAGGFTRVPPPPRKWRNCWWMAWFGSPGAGSCHDEEGGRNIL